MTFLDTPPRQTERSFQAQVVKAAQRLGWQTYHTYDSRRSSSGFPDLVLIRRPRVLFVEVKSDRGRVADVQRAWIEELRACGQEAYIWRPSSWELVEKLLKCREAPCR